MYCGRCGMETDYEKQKIIQNGETIEVHYYAKCSNCNEELGEKEIFHRTNWDYLTNEELEEIKNESTKIRTRI